MKRSIPILLYHHVSPDREITPAGLEAQLMHLLEQGYRSLSLDEVVAFTQGKLALDRPGFAVTFDDGYLDNWVYAFPILQKLSVKATFYLITERVEAVERLRGPAECQDTRTAERAAGGFLSWREAREMSANSLMSFGSHTQSHRRFVRKSEYENLESELRGSRQLIESQLKQACGHLAWPWGDYENAWLPQLPGLGYRSAVTTLAGANTVGSDPLRLKRIKVGREGLDWLEGRLRWNTGAMAAAGYGLFYGWDRRFKVWRNAESPYSHG